MNVEKMLKESRIPACADESTVRETIRKSKESFIKGENRQPLSYPAFLLGQFRMIQKRWWLLQFALLVFAGHLLAVETDLVYIRRSLGVYATLFVVLLIPELWKNLTNRCLEVEGASFYSLRQVYAARILLFGMVDASLLAMFGGSVCGICGFAFADLAIQFLLPIILTAGICFVVFGLQHRNMLTVIAPCVLWAIIWWAIIADDQIYSAILYPSWAGVLTASCLFLLFTLHHVLKSCHYCMERSSSYGIVSE